MNAWASEQAKVSGLPIHPDRHLFLLFAACAWMAVLIGFYPAVLARYQGHADFPAPLILQLHVFAASGWLVLLTLQVLLIRNGRFDLHRMLGIAGACLIPVILVTSIGSEIESQRFYSPKYPANLRFFAAVIVQMLVFAACSSAAIVMRRDPAAHKRLILLATSMLLVAPYNRWWGEGLYKLFGDGFLGMIVHNFAGPDLLMLTGALYDLITRRRIHPVYLIGIPAILACEIAASLIYHHPQWPTLARRMVGI